MLRIVLFASVVAFSACASVGPAPPSRTAAGPSGGISVSDVTTGFLVAVMDGCAAAAEAGKTLEELNSPLLVRDDNRAMEKRSGYAPWAPKIGQGVVMIDQGEASCEVRVYGIAIDLSFEAIAVKLGERGYASEPVPPQGAKYFQRQLKKTVAGKTVKVSLRGNEPGAAGMVSRFSTATAFITTSAP